MKSFVVVSDDAELDIHPCPHYPKTHIEIVINSSFSFHLCREDAYEFAEKISLCASALLNDNKKTAKKKSG